MTAFPFNLVVFDHDRIPPASLDKALDILTRCRGIKITADIYLVTADFMTLVLNLLRLPGCMDGAIKLYCLSAYDGELDKDGIHTSIRKQALVHLRHELQKLERETLGLDLSAVLSHVRERLPHPSDTKT